VLATKGLFAREGCPVKIRTGGMPRIIVKKGQRRGLRNRRSWRPTRNRRSYSLAVHVKKIAKKTLLAIWI
jgi:hypothetical protein